MYGVKMVATVVMGRKCVHKIFAWTGNGAALPLPSRQTRELEPASERGPGHIYGTTGFVSRPPDEDVVRTVTHISRVTACRAPYSRLVFIYIMYSLPATKSCVHKLYKENIMYMYNI